MRGFGILARRLTCGRVIDLDIQCFGSSFFSLLLGFDIRSSTTIACFEKSLCLLLLLCSLLCRCFFAFFLLFFNQLILMLQYLQFDLNNIWITALFF